MPRFYVNFMVVRRTCLPFLGRPKENLVVRKIIFSTFFNTFNVIFFMKIGCPLDNQPNYFWLSVTNFGRHWRPDDYKNRALIYN